MMKMQVIMFISVVCYCLCVILGAETARTAPTTGGAIRFSNLVYVHDTTTPSTNADRSREAVVELLDEHNKVSLIDRPLLNSSSVTLIEINNNHNNRPSPQTSDQCERFCVKKEDVSVRLAKHYLSTHQSGRRDPVIAPRQESLVQVPPRGKGDPLGAIYSYVERHNNDDSSSTMFIVASDASPLPDERDWDFPEMDSHFRQKQSKDLLVVLLSRSPESKVYKEWEAALEKLPSLQSEIRSPTDTCLSCTQEEPPRNAAVVGEERHHQPHDVGSVGSVSSVGSVGSEEESPVGSGEEPPSGVVEPTETPENGLPIPPPQNCSHDVLLELYFGVDLASWTELKDLLSSTAKTVREAFPNVAFGLGYSKSKDDQDCLGLQSNFSSSIDDFVDGLAAIPSQPGVGSATCHLNLMNYVYSNRDESLASGLKSHNIMQVYVMVVESELYFNENLPSEQYVGLEDLAYNGDSRSPNCSAGYPSAEHMAHTLNDNDVYVLTFSSTGDNSRELFQTMLGDYGASNRVANYELKFEDFESSLMATLEDLVCTQIPAQRQGSLDSNGKHPSSTCDMYKLWIAIDEQDLVEDSTKTTVVSELKTFTQLVLQDIPGSLIGISTFSDKSVSQTPAYDESNKVISFTDAQENLLEFLDKQPLDAPRVVGQSSALDAVWHILRRQPWVSSSDDDDDDGYVKYLILVASNTGHLRSDGSPYGGLPVSLDMQGPEGDYIDPQSLSQLLSENGVTLVLLGNSTNSNPTEEFWSLLSHQVPEVVYVPADWKYISDELYLFIHGNCNLGGEFVESGVIRLSTAVVGGPFPSMFSRVAESTSASDEASTVKEATANTGLQASVNTTAVVAGAAAGLGVAGLAGLLLYSISRSKVEDDESDDEYDMSMEGPMHGEHNDADKVVKVGTDFFR